MNIAKNAHHYGNDRYKNSHMQEISTIQIALTTNPAINLQLEETPNRKLKFLPQTFG